MTEDEIAAKRAHRQEKKEKFKEFTEKAKVDREKRAAEMDKVSCISRGQVEGLQTNTHDNMHFLRPYNKHYALEAPSTNLAQENTGSNNTNKATFLGEQNTQLDKLKAVEDFERLKAKKFPTR